MGELLGDLLMQLIFQPHYPDPVEPPKVSVSAFKYYMLALAFVFALIILYGQYIVESYISEFFPNLGLKRYIMRFSLLYLYYVNEWADYTLSWFYKNKNKQTDHRDLNGIHVTYEEDQTISDSPVTTTYNFYSAISDKRTTVKIVDLGDGEGDTQRDQQMPQASVSDTELVSPPRSRRRKFRVISREGYMTTVYGHSLKTTHY